MNNLFDIDEWKVIQRSFEPDKQLSAESIFSIGNGCFGQRANFEEHYSGESLQGSYLGGIYYPDKTKVGWWKNGYPEYFAKVLNSCNWIGIDVWIDEQQIDLNKCTVKSFYRELNLRNGLLTRRCHLLLDGNKEIEVISERFCSMDDDHIAAINYSVRPLNFDGLFRCEVYLNGDVSNHDSNYGKVFWKEKQKEISDSHAFLLSQTKKTKFLVCHAMKFSFQEEGKIINIKSKYIQNKMYVSSVFNHPMKKGCSYKVTKYVSIVSSLNESKSNLLKKSVFYVEKAYNQGFESLFKRHSKSWSDIWDTADVTIKGNPSCQQSIRFNIFHLYQTYRGNNEKLNIGPKGFTGEKYGGATYWDTEAYCLPFYLMTSGPKVARQLLMYRYHHLEKAIENAQKLGFKNGAALYPMVTMNGEECHNEWEITFEEIHRNGAIAFAIYNYWRHSGDVDYVRDYGKKVLVAISRFWYQRFNWSESKNKFVMLGVTGPNEYENNVNNNWYTNYIAKWCIDYTLEIDKDSTYGSSLISNEEFENWSNLSEKISLEKIKNTNIWIQQDGFLDKEMSSVDDLKSIERPINQNWSWDRILRSVYIKQADVLQGIYLFEDDFSLDEIQDNFDFYEPKTVHESSLSPCIHVILACLLCYDQKAYELYLRSSRLDLDDYNKEVSEGLHITSMAGTWLSVIEGFAGLRITEKGLRLNPRIPDKWSSISFKIRYHAYVLEFYIDKYEVRIKKNGGDNLIINVNGKRVELKEENESIISLIGSKRNP